MPKDYGINHKVNEVWILISKAMIKSGMERGVVQLVDSPISHTVVCQIGEDWFYFADKRSWRCSAQEYTATTPWYSIVNYIYEALESFFEEDKYDEDYSYYENFLRSNGIE